MPVLAVMGDRKSCGIAEAIGRAMYDFGDLGQRSDGPYADARHEQTGPTGSIHRVRPARSSR